MKTLTLVAAFVLVAAPLAAQDSTAPAKAPTAKIAGDWDFSFTSPQGAANWRIKLDQSGDTVTGTAATDFGQLEVSDGWITGNDLSFALHLNYNGTPIQVNFAGTVKGDTLQGNVDVVGANMQFPFMAVKASGASPSTSSPHASPYDRSRLVRQPVR